MLQNSNTSITYCLIFKPSTCIIKNSQTILEKKFKLYHSNDDKRPPLMFWLPNLRKHRTRSRFITAAQKISCQSIELDVLMIRGTTILYLKKLANK